MEVERFGGKYVYYGPTGLTYFVSPIIGENRACAKITVGPFLMIDKDDYVDGDLMERLHLNAEAILSILKELNNIPFISSDKVTPLSNLLFMSVGFMNNVNKAKEQIDTQKSNSVQTQISHYIIELKTSEEAKHYPFATEDKLLDCIARSDRDGVGKYLNELLGFIFLITGNDLQIAKSRVYELLVLISRKSVASGADPEKTLWMCHDYMQTIPKLNSMEDLCFWMAKVTNTFMDTLFTNMDVKHDNIIHRAMHYVYAHYDEKISLDSLAKEIFISPAYLGRIFKSETGRSFTDFLSNIRIEKSKDLLRNSDMKVVDIASVVGFEDQSYFTKTFRKKIGLSPSEYRTQQKNGGLTK